MKINAIVSAMVVAPAAAVCAAALWSAPVAQAGEPNTSCTDWGNFVACRTTAFDIESTSGYTVDCYYYEDGSSQCN
ncbi:MAG: hypothetical protein KIH64_010455 [Mycobacterium sp.]|nr:hypothetical protein [Mycobacterium sp.]